MNHEFAKMENVKVLDHLAEMVFSNNNNNNNNNNRRPIEIRVTSMIVAMFKSSFQVGCVDEMQRRINKEQNASQVVVSSECGKFSYIIDRHLCYNINDEKTQMEESAYGSFYDAASSNLFPILHLPFLSGERYMLKRDVPMALEIANEEEEEEEEERDIIEKKEGKHNSVDASLQHYHQFSLHSKRSTV